MTDQNDNGAQGSGGEDAITNVKAEMNRKLSNVEQKMASLEQTNAALLAQLQAMSQPKGATGQAGSTTNLSEVWYDKPELAAEAVIQAAEKRIESKIAAREATTAKTNQTLTQLVSEFPELNDSNHDLYKKAIETYNSYSADDRSSPVAYKAAVREAAMALGIQPVSKRSDDYVSDTDNYTLSGSSTGSSSRSSKRGADRSGLTNEMVEFAKLVGVDIDNPKTKERVKQRATRKFNRWE